MEDWDSGGLNKKKNRWRLRKEVRDEEEEEEEDLQEEEVWAVLKQSREDSSSPKLFTRKGQAGNDRQIPQWRLPAVPKVIPRANNSEGKFVNSSHHHQSSAPVNIPQWSKSYNNRMSLRDGDDGYDDDEDEDGDDDDDDEGMVPPHEYIARRVARRNERASSSMCEGIGRTLKGRDLSKLRNAILAKTGFLE